MIEAVQMSIYYDAALEAMGHTGHTENSVSAFHWEKSKWSHNIGTKERKWTIGNLAADSRQLNMAALP